MFTFKKLLGVKIIYIYYIINEKIPVNQTTKNSIYNNVTNVNICFRVYYNKKVKLLTCTKLKV